MLKKAGIVVAAASVGLLALSPLAFAGDKGHGHSGHNGDSFSLEQEGDGGNNACSNAQGTESGDAGDSAALLGILPILNSASVSALNNVNALQCTNLLNNNLNENNVQLNVLGGGEIND